MLKRLQQKWRNKTGYFQFTEGKNLSEITYRVLGKLANIGDKELIAHQLHFEADEYGEPNATVILPGRDNNPFATIAETLWTFAARNDASSLSRWLPGALDLSDDGKTWSSAYGPRLRYWRTRSQHILDQVEMLLFRLKKGKAPPVAVLWDPSVDGFIETAKNYANCISIQFAIRDEGLNVYVNTHETDIIYGVTINAFEWCFLGTFLADQLRIPFCHYYQSGTSINFQGDADKIIRHKYVAPPYLRTDKSILPVFAMRDSFVICSPENLRLLCNKIYDAAINNLLGYITADFVRALPSRLADFTWALVAESLLNSSGDEYLTCLQKISYTPLVLSLLDIGIRRRKEVLWQCSEFHKLWNSTEDEIAAANFLKRLYKLNECYNLQ